MSFSVKSGVSGPLQRIPPAASCSHTQWAWQYQSRQLPGCWSRSTVIRPRGISTSTVGFVSANGNATYSASLSSVAGFVIRFTMSNHGSSSYSVTTVVTLLHPWSMRSTTSRAPIPGSRSRRADVSAAWLTVRSGAARSSSRARPVQRALCAPPCTYTSWFSPDHAAGRTEHDVEPAGLHLERRAVVPWRVGRALTFRECQVAQRGDVSRHDQRRAVGEIHGRPLLAVVREPPPRAV